MFQGRGVDCLYCPSGGGGAGGGGGGCEVVLRDG